MANYYIELGGGGGGSTSLTIGTIDSVTASANGLVFSSNVLTAQSASATVPGMVNTTTQTMAGAKTFSSVLTVANLINSGLTANTVAYANGSKQLTSSAVTPTELGYVSGVTSALQTQIDAKQASFTIGAVDTAANSTVLTLSAGVLSIQSATTSRAGIVTAAAQNLDGVKTFISKPVMSAGFTSSAASAVNGSADAVQLTVKANGTQTSNLMNFTNSSDTVLSSFTGLGNLVFAGTSSTAVPFIKFAQVDGDTGVSGISTIASEGLVIGYGNQEAIWIKSNYIVLNPSARVHIYSVGSSSSPGLCFSNDTGTGWYKPATNQWGWTASSNKPTLGLAANAVTITGNLATTAAADVIQATIKGNATQTNNIIEIQKSDATVNFSVGNTGITTIGATSTTPQHVINGAVKTDGAQVGTLSNAPSAGNPTGYLKVTINGTTSYIPYWQ